MAGVLGDWLNQRGYAAAARPLDLLAKHWSKSHTDQPDPDCPACQALQTLPGLDAARTHLADARASLRAAAASLQEPQQPHP